MARSMRDTVISAYGVQSEDEGIQEEMVSALFLSRKCSEMRGKQILESEDEIQEEMSRSDSPEDCYPTRMLSSLVSVLFLASKCS